ncbi:ornithine cyclodeaminase [Sedimenticola hydrogenitrophicus]|uniref:ornithine cyclodeaminase n=1 Tax=Sedimenticola hydrogenitrophicus TaxID=2967975 RepID=UPI0021A86DBD|nr:ornithine cyclodeaminase [Sedimenticola hydrogenitrophicus]
MRLITISHLKQLIRETGMDHFLRQNLASLEAAFGRWDEFRKSPRHATHYPQGVIELMPCADEEFYSFKYVNGHPKNTAAGRLSVVALGMLANARNGYPLMLSEMTLLTAIRTASTTALGAKYLARPESRHLALIGTGAQAEFQLLALRQVLPIEQVSYFDTDPRAMGKFARNMAGYATLIPCNSIDAALTDSDVVVTATAARQHNRLLGPGMIPPGSHIHAMGGDCPGKTELDPALLAQCRIVVEYLPQSLEEGEIQLAKETPVHAELWELVNGDKPGRQDPGELTLFDSVGFALEDFAILQLVYQLACDLNIGEEVDLIPSPADPKDLYRVLFSPPSP